MITFNLIDPQQSAIAFTLVTFPDGQPHIKIDLRSIESIDRSETVCIISRAASTSDLMLILFAKNALDYLEFEKVDLKISYLLTARMDRVLLEGEPFSLKVTANLLNQAGFHRISIFDPHSDVTTALIDRCYAISNHRFVEDALAAYFSAHEKTRFCLVSPDAGALKKIYKLAAYLNVEEVVECTKERDIKTGALTNFDTSEDDLSGRICVIVDDICDGGGTFAGNAKMLREKGAEKVILIVSHGIFSKGSRIENVDEVYTTDSFREVEGVNCLPVSKYLF